MSLSRFSLALASIALLAFRVAPAAPPTIANAIATELKHALADGDVSRHQPEIDQACPGLREGALAWATRYNTSSAASAAAAGNTSTNDLLASVILPKSHPDLFRYLEFWSRADISPRTPEGHYPINVFDDFTSVTANGRGFVVLNSGKSYHVLWFEPSNLHSAWPAESYGELAGAARLGAALALVQDALLAVRNNQDLAAFTATPDVKWTWGNPAQWVYVEQVWQGKKMGFFPLQDRLTHMDKPTALLGLWIRENGASNLALEFNLVTIPDAKKYLGWRIGSIEKSAAPESEKAD